MDELKVKEILNGYRESVENTKEALRLAGMSENQIILHTINFPDFDRMIPEDTVKFYRDVKKLLIIHLDKLGLSSRQIAKRLGGNGSTFVLKIINEYHELNKPDKANIEEVSE